MQIDFPRTDPGWRRPCSLEPRERQNRFEPPFPGDAGKRIDIASPSGDLEINTIIGYLQLIGVAGECSTGVFATAEVACPLLTTDVLALV
ncbi:hypothetical protein E0H36_32080 [Rhizobium leguminosarum bv. viciae]|nr:hypothetical protein CHR56_01190 [Rhizobium leguminosarum bv. viciae]TBZ27193.1 hypothetical protein E0H36_32080 [Rhizobium leguminosarum bv. viciae]TBZ35050.1 hypothetical protein E0H47_25225 [Rhizobium leguminosarum bv. viciae]